MAFIFWENFGKTGRKRRSIFIFFYPFPFYSSFLFFYSYLLFVSHKTHNAVLPPT